MKTKKYRSAPRRVISPLSVSSLSDMDQLTKVARGGTIIDASITGFLLKVKREDLVPQNLRKNLSIDSLVGCRVLIELPQLNLQMAGRVVRTQLVGKAGFEIGIDFSEDAPDYWRECLLDLLPAPGEIE